MPAPQLVSARSAGAAAAGAVVLSGALRITVLTPRLLRIEWDSTRTFTDSRTQVAIHRRLPVPSFTTHDEGGVLTVDTGRVRLTWHGGNNRPDASNLRIDIQDGEATIAWIPGTLDDGNLGARTARWIATTAIPGPTAVRSRLRKGSSRAPTGTWWTIRRAS